ncbi:MAG: hypothetical protein GVY21_09540 [Gammaproteobacteria bacterium]|jgi:hypothetical protein|nr:hypothetical protein [Gammaproteobacteria bacterium]
MNERSEQRFRRAVGGVALAGSLLVGGAVLAQPVEQANERAQEHAQTQAEERQVYGWELMSAQERQAYRERMRNAGSAEEQARIRAEHHAQMQARARAQGVTLPDMPMQRGPGKGDGKGMGPGARTGKGPGSGGGAGKGSGGGQGKGPGR